MIFVKRCCNSSIKGTGNAISFTAFNISIDGVFKTDFDRIFDLYVEHGVIEKDTPGAREKVLTLIIENGIYSFKEMI